jgi:imidazolonepropionase-like amidohydrolase
MAAQQTGLLPKEAMAMITIEAARILGIDNRVGSLEKGKDAGRRDVLTVTRLSSLRTASVR